MGLLAITDSMSSAEKRRHIEEHQEELEKQQKIDSKQRSLQRVIDAKRYAARRRKRKDRKHAREYIPRLHQCIQVNPLRQRIITPKVYKRPTDDEIHPAYEIFMLWRVSNLVEQRADMTLSRACRSRMGDEMDHILFAICYRTRSAEKDALRLRRKRQEAAKRDGEAGKQAEELAKKQREYQDYARSLYRYMTVNPLNRVLAKRRMPKNSEGGRLVVTVSLWMVDEPIELVK